MKSFKLSFGALYSFCAFCACKNYHEKKKENCLNDLIYITTEYVIAESVLIMTIFFNNHNLF